MTGHEAYHRLEQSISVYEYDSADNGPECEVITRILAKHSLYVIEAEKKVFHVNRYFEAAALVLFGKSFDKLTVEHSTIVRNRVTATLVARGLA